MNINIYNIMPNFKPKANKKIKVNKKSTVTLDGKHNEKMAEFNTIQEKTIPELLKKKKELRRKLKKVNNIEEQLDIQDEIKHIKKIVYNLSQEKEKYLLENSNILRKRRKCRKELILIKKRYYIPFLILIKR